MIDLHISDITFQPAGEHQQRAGLLGWARCVLDGWLRLDGLAVRRSAFGDLRVFFPERIDRQDRRHAIVWPLDPEDRAEIEATILRHIDGLGVLP